MFKTFLKLLKESFISVLPITLVILLIAPFIGIDMGTILSFLLNAVLLSVGLALFQLGAFESTGVISQEIGKYVVKKRNAFILIIVAFLVGFLITIAEPALWVLGDQLKSVLSEMVLVLTVAIGVGIFLVVGLLRIVFGIKLRILFMILYLITFIVAALVNIKNPEFIALAFDSGGVTTGPIAVPFIIGLAYGLSKARGDKSKDNDSFGLVGIASVGPILAVLILGLFIEIDPSQIVTSGTQMGLLDYFKQYLWQMAIAISPFILFFIVFQIIGFKFEKKRVIKVLIAFVYTYIGMVLFLTGANAGFANIGNYIGAFFGATDYNWILIVLGLVFGLLIASSEPSVIALNKQVEEVSAGSVSKRSMMIGLAGGVSIAIGLAMVRVLTGVSIWWFLIPGYIISIALSFITPELFSSIAFDSGGAVSGAMTSAFLMPFALGAASTIEGANVLTDAFGLVAFVAMSPLITIQIIGLIYKHKSKRHIVIELDVDDIIDI